MPLQNRTLPTGDIVADPARGTLTGNRGIIHREDQTLGTARWSHHAWICCTLDWQGRKRAVMQGRKWTELFFLDEATAFAAGHRPCGYCRRPAYNTFTEAWADAHKTRPKAPDMDRILHTARVTKTRQQIRHNAPINTLPNGTFIMHNNQPHLIWNGLHPYHPAGYDTPVKPPIGTVTILTPAPTVKALQSGYIPQTACQPQ